MLREYETHEPVCAVNQKNYDKQFPGIAEEQKAKEAPKVQTSAKP